MGATSEALQIGLVDELQDYSQIVPQALAWLRRHLALPRHAFLANRRVARADLGHLFEDDDLQAAQAFVEGWFSAPTQAALAALVAQLQARKKE